MAGVSAVSASVLPISSPARDGRCRDLVVPAISASDMPTSRPSAGRPPPGSCSSRNFRKRYANLAAQRGTAAARIPAIPAISASDIPMAGGLAWQAWDGKLLEHGSWRPGILSPRMEVGKSTSGAAACSFTERWRCGRLSRRASMMPILSRWARQTYATTLLRNVKDKTCALAAVRARKIVFVHRVEGAGERRASAIHHE
jgi:hypothetical protein